MLSIGGDSLDSILHQVYTNLIEGGEHISGPTKGPNLELIGATLELSNPLARLSRSYARGRPFSAIGELVWYLAGSDQVGFIHHYIPNQPYHGMDIGGALRGAYGPRLRGSGINGQIDRVIEVLREKPTSRQAVIQLFDRGDLAERIGDLPCTCVLQFFVRNDKLDALTYMRSNDAYFGLPHDFFCFTMIQELIARSLQLEVGRYVHMVGSLHLYDKQVNDAKGYLGEGIHPPKSMPRMPTGEPWASVQSFVENELRIRAGSFGEKEVSDLGTGYWDDLTRMVIGANLRPSDEAELTAIRSSLGDSYYTTYLTDRQNRAG